jgi:hypothetical protein
VQAAFKVNAGGEGGDGADARAVSRATVQRLGRLLLQRSALVPPAEMARLIAILTPSGLVCRRWPGPCLEPLVLPSDRSRACAVCAVVVVGECVCEGMCVCLRVYVCMRVFCTSCGTSASLRAPCLRSRGRGA